MDFLYGNHYNHIDFQKHSHELVDWMFSYLKEIEKYPIKPDIKPGEIYNALPEKPPMNGEAFDKIFKDFMLN